jgi:hypothetical protein
MKYLKTYESVLSESQMIDKYGQVALLECDSVIKDIKDFLLELCDVGFNVNVDYSDRTLTLNEKRPVLSLVISGPPELFEGNIDIYNEVVQTIKDYLNSNDYAFSDLNWDGSSERSFRMLFEKIWITSESVTGYDDGDEVLSNSKDILIELEDDGIGVNVDDMDTRGRLGFGVHIGLGDEDLPETYFNFEKYADDLLRLDEYLQSNGYKFVNALTFNELYYKGLWNRDYYTSFEMSRLVRDISTNSRISFIDIRYDRVDGLYSTKK